MGITTLAAKRILPIAIIGIVAAALCLVVSAVQLADYSDFADIDSSVPTSAPGSPSSSSARSWPSPERSSRVPSGAGGEPAAEPSRRQRRRTKRDPEPPILRVPAGHHVGSDAHLCRRRRRRPPPPTGYVPDGEPVEFETLGIVSDTTGINLGEHILRLGNDDDIEAAGSAPGGRRGLAVRRRRSSTRIGEIPAGTVVLIGIIDISCTPADEAGLVRGDDGELAMFAPGHVPEPIECFAANVIGRRAARRRRRRPTGVDRRRRARPLRACRRRRSGSTT